jgi:DNA replication protein DnaC
MKPRTPPRNDPPKPEKALDGAVRRAANPEAVAILENPALSDEEKCKALFGHASYQCVGCNTKIYWPGVCDECVDEFDKKHGAVKTIQEQLLQVGVPAGLVRSTWKNFDMPNQKRHALMARRIAHLQTWQGKPERVCILGGPPGTGKTHMAIATLRRRVKTQGTDGCHFVHCAGLVKRISDYSMRDPLEEFTKDRFLILDDWGQDLSIETAGRNTLIGFLLNRLDRGLVTLLTTNWTLNDFENVEPRLASRLQQALHISTRGFGDRRMG